MWGLAYCLKIFIYCTCVSVCAAICGGQKTVCRNQFSPSTMWVLRLRLWLSGECRNPACSTPAPSTLTCCLGCWVTVSS